jgi:hypothetical protein
MYQCKFVEYKKSMAIPIIRCDIVSWCDNRMIGSLRKNGWDLRAQILHALEDVFLNTITKLHAILSTITGDIAI